MKFFIFLLCIIPYLVFSQQTFELCDGETKTITYYAESNNVGTNVWTVNNMTFITEELTYTFDQSGTYNIVLRRENGPCYQEETYQVIVVDCPGIIYWVPNTFTPDGNEFNQLFGPIITEGVDINGFTFIIFNRWGEVIFESQNPEGKWDGTFKGKKVQDGVYSWKLVFNIFGNDGKITDSGHVTLIR
jgi:gliding motility-associated-like protein